MKLLFENWRRYTDTIDIKLSESNHLLFEGEDLSPEVQKKIDKMIQDELKGGVKEKIEQEIESKDEQWIEDVANGIDNVIKMAEKSVGEIKRCLKGVRDKAAAAQCPEITPDQLAQWLGRGAAGTAAGVFITAATSMPGFEGLLGAFVALQAARMVLPLVIQSPSSDDIKPTGLRYPKRGGPPVELDETKLIFEIWRRYLKEGYGYVLNPNEPPSIKEVIARWVEGERAFEEEDFHATFPIDDLLEYRDFSYDYNKLPLEEMEKLKKDLRDVGITSPIVVEVGKNGQAVIVDEGQIIELAKQLNIKEVPVMFEFKDFVQKANKVTEEPATINKNLEDQEENPLEQSMPGRDSSLDL